MPWLGYKFLFQMSLKNLYGITLVRPPSMLAYTPEISLYVYYALLPLVLLAVLLFLKISEKLSGSKPKRGKAISKNSVSKKPLIILMVQVAGCALIGYFLIVNSYDPVKKRLLLIEYYAENEQWTEVLKTSRKVKEYDFRVNFQQNRALSHLGQLPDSLFRYPQLLGSYGLFIDATMAGSATMPTSDLYFDLGFMSESQHWAFEAQTLLPDSPRILKRLVMINLVNRKFNVAEMFLNVLNKNSLCREWARKYGKYVADTTLAAADKVIAEKRRFTPPKAVINTGTEECLKLLIETNRNNRMAYDYLVSYYILDSHFTKFVDYLQYYSFYNIKILPKSWEEALTVYVAKTKTLPQYLSPQMVSNNCIQQFTNFTSKIKQFNNSLPEAKNAVYKDFGDTYWYYVLYLSPKVTNVLTNKTRVQ
jgi:hypothetical protein